MKKRFLAMMLAATMSVGALAGCGGGGEKKDDNTVTLWATGSSNVEESFQTLVDSFNKQSDTYKVQLKFVLNGTGTQTLVDMVAAAKKAGQTDTDYDLVDFGGDDWSNIVSQIGEDSFVKLDDSKIPNNKTVTAQAAQSPDYCQPYRGTDVVLAYNADKVKNPPKTLDELVKWIKANPGRFAYNTPGTGGAGDSFARTSVYNFIKDESAMTSADPKWEKQWDDGFAFLKDLHASMYKSGGAIVYPNKNQGTLDLLANGEIDMCPNWADMILAQRADGTISENIKITTIDPAFTGSVQSLAIPSIGSHEEGAYAFINYILSDEAQNTLVKDMAAIPLVDTANLDLSGFEELENLDVSKFRILSIGDLATDFNERWDNEIGSLG